MGQAPEQPERSLHVQHVVIAVALYDHTGHKLRFKSIYNLNYSHENVSSSALNISSEVFHDPEICTWIHRQHIPAISEQYICSPFLFISRTAVSDSFPCSCMRMLPSHQVCKLDVLQ